MSPVPPAMSRMRRLEVGSEGMRPGESEETNWSLKILVSPVSTRPVRKKNVGRERTSRCGASQRT